MKLAKKFGAMAVSAAFFLVTTPVAAQSYLDEYYYTTASDAAAASGALVGLSLLSCCLPLVIWIVIGGILAYVVYKDAKKNKVDSPALWAILTFFFTLIGILVYFLAIRPEAMKKLETVAPSTKEEAKK